MLNTSKKGDQSELLACAWLLEQGYEVFRNVSSVGPIDIIAVNEDETILIDVKTCSLMKDWGEITIGATSMSKASKALGVKRLLVYKGHVSWKLHDLEQYI